MRTLAFTIHAPGRGGGTDPLALVAVLDGPDGVAGCILRTWQTERDDIDAALRDQGLRRISEWAVDDQGGQYARVEGIDTEIATPDQLRTLYRQDVAGSRDYVLGYGQWWTKENS